MLEAETNRRVFCACARNFLAVYPVKEWLRLRHENGKYKITYKGFYYGKDGETYKL